ncbi:G1/S-specific cyclin-E [Anopheles marshallii]|uniref:G1/S-specific cyclin-E n=1 Tax=Anopheles marshallii TaxID=1521116 RepID=UPI00237B09BF|nr:G1/S-specific cyclin-E [Anopheles marshallii]
MDNTNRSDNHRLPAIEVSQPEPKRRSRKRKNTSESQQHEESETVQQSAKKRRNSQSVRTSPDGAVASTSSTASVNVPAHAAKSSTSSTTTAAALPAGPSMPSIASSASLSSVGSNKDAEYTSDTPGSSEFYVNDIDYFHLDSPATVSSIGMSPFGRDTIANGDGTADWHTKQDHPSLPCSGPITHPPIEMYGKARARIRSEVWGDIITPSHKLRSCPLPNLTWANRQQMWDLMCRKDELAWIAREPTMFDSHPGLQPRMRAILLDWLNEVCEVYKLHRETYYLAVDYIDRYLTCKKELKKSHLQLLGITSLFIAAKVEEIYPPKIGEFAYVTDGACTDEDILREELLVLTALEWRINPVTVMGWLGLYMQVIVSSREESHLMSARNECPSAKSPSRKRKITDENEDSNNIKKMKVAQKSPATKTDDAFMYPQFSGMEFAHTAQLIDLCSLDVGLTNFKYSVIAAAAISHTYDRKTAMLVSGFRWEEIAPCARWMEPYFQVICDENASSPLTLLESNEPIKYCHGLKHVCPNLVSDSSHIIQTHTTSLDMLDLVSIKIEQMESSVRMGLLEASPAPVSLEPEDGILTPPSSNRKSLETLGSVITAVSVVAPDVITNVVRVNDANVIGATWSNS